MKNSRIRGIESILLGASLSAVPISNADAAEYNLSIPNGSVAIPDGNLNGIVFSFNVSEAPANSQITSLNSVGLDILGGYNGDLRAYLRHETAGGIVGFASLFNQPGKDNSLSLGYSNPGMNVLLMNSGNNIHNYQNPIFNAVYNGNGQVTGNWASEQNFDSFAGLDPNGRWDFWFGDLTGGDVSTVQSLSFNLDYSVVPETVNTALGILGGIAAIAAAGKAYRNRNKSRK